ncbi:hypothetical protein [Kocuria sp.]|uniref:hypothetical protein n=1 Tax=Kocuria sp. TaxID=1871328 RepID=UPI0026DF7220|nr:hypothetical protein [Kocuria sp.]MDO5618009.1 hypothetical protein [Kocuria sp.]
MGFFAEHLAARRDQKELGQGVWRRAHDRFRRGLDRFHQVLEQVQDPELVASAVPVANSLADLLPRVRQICMTAQTFAPDQEQEIPHSEGGWLHDLHRELSRAGNDLAQAAEALAMARFRSSSVDATLAHQLSLSALTRRTDAVAQRVEQAEALLAAHNL